MNQVLLQCVRKSLVSSSWSQILRLSAASASLSLTLSCGLLPSSTQTSGVDRRAQSVSEPASGFDPKLQQKLQTTLANARNYILNKRKVPGFYWDEPMNGDVSTDALVLALGKRLGKLTSDSSYAMAVVKDIFLQMSGKTGWTAYPGGPINPEITAITLFCLKELGIGRDDPRVKAAWAEFDRNGGIGKLRLYARTFLALVGLFPEGALEVSPKFLGLPNDFPVNIKKLGIVGDVTVPIIALSYLGRQQDHRLLAYQKSIDSWMQEEIKMGDPSAAGKNRPKNCTLPENMEALVTMLKEVESNLGKYRDCVFQSEATKKPSLFARFREILKGRPSKNMLRALNFVIDRMVSGSTDFWVEQAVARTLQAQSEEGGGWYSALTTLGSIRLLQEAQRVKLGNFQDRMDRGWEALLRARRPTVDGYSATEFMYSGTWDTASSLEALVKLNGTDLELPEAAVKQTVDWLLKEAVWREGSGGRYASWSFDQTAKSPDVDTTAYVLHALGDSTQGSDPRALDTIQKSLSWIISQQNKDGGFAVWQKNGKWSLMVEKMYKLVFSGADLPFRDVSQSDVSGRVLTMLASIEPLSGNQLPAVQKAKRRACNYLAKTMPKVKDLPVRLQSGTWMSNYVYSAAANLSGLANADCHEDVQSGLATWLVSKQNWDGGWGESNESYQALTFIPAASTLSQTGTALIGLEFYYERLEKSGKEPPLWLTQAIVKGLQFIASKSNFGMNFAEREFTGVVLKGDLYCRYELVPAYTTLFVLAKWRKMTTSISSSDQEEE